MAARPARRGKFDENELEVVQAEIAAHKEYLEFLDSQLTGRFWVKRNVVAEAELKDLSVMLERLQQTLDAERLELFEQRVVGLRQEVAEKAEGVRRKDWFGPRAAKAGHRVTYERLCRARESLVEAEEMGRLLVMDLNVLREQCGELELAHRQAVTRRDTVRAQLAAMEEAHDVEERRYEGFIERSAAPPKGAPVLVVGPLSRRGVDRDVRRAFENLRLKRYTFLLRDRAWWLETVLFDEKQMGEIARQPYLIVGGEKAKVELVWR